MYTSAMVFDVDKQGLRGLSGLSPIITFKKYPGGQGGSKESQVYSSFIAETRQLVISYYGGEYYGG